MSKAEAARRARAIVVEYLKASTGNEELGRLTTAEKALQDKITHVLLEVANAKTLVHR